MHTITKAVATGATSLALIGLPTGSALASDGGYDSSYTSNGSTIIKIGKYGALSRTHNLAWVNVKVTCSPDVSDAALTATLAQVTNGNAQESTGTVAAFNAFECNGREEWVSVPIRRPLGGFKWVKGKARVFDVCFATYDPGNGWTKDFASGRTITLR